MMKRMMVVVVGSVMALSSTLVWADAKSNIEVTDTIAIQQGDNKADTTVIGGQGVEADANASNLSVQAGSTGTGTVGSNSTDVRVNNVTAIQQGNNTATTTVIGGQDVKAEANATNVNIKAKNSE